jgi:hypothetical protein
VLFLCAGSGSAQARRKLPSSAPRPSIVTDIRQVDFLNFTYHSSLCSKDIGQGIGATVRVRKGEFKNKDVSFVVDKKIIYGDVTSDGREEAIVNIGCGENIANFSLSEVFIYTIQNGRATLLAEINDKDMQRDYSSYYRNGELWRIADNGVKVRNGNLAIEKFAEGSMSVPDYIVTLEYRLNGVNLTLSGKPQRRNFRR